MEYYFSLSFELHLQCLSYLVCKIIHEYIYYFDLFTGIYPPMMVLNTPVVPTSVQSQLELLSQCNAELQKELSQNGGMKQASVSINQG